MAAKRILDVNESSLVDLKAELFRKEEQFKRDKHTQENNITKHHTKKPPVWIKPKKAAVKSLTTKYNKEDAEEEKTLDKSRLMLEAKALLYEKMAKGEIEEEEDDEKEGRFLVDFHKKVYGKLDVGSEQSEEASFNTTEPAEPDEEWVDYVDSLGRSRRCLRRDLEQLQQVDKDLTPRRSPSPPTLLSEDMRRELMRQKWEKEEEEAARRPVGPVHYQNVQFDEVRSHGVGYYQFSKDELERQKQMEMLNKLREQTTEQRARREKLKEKRKAALDARLSKVRARKMKRLGEEGEPRDEKTMRAANEDHQEDKGDAGRPGGNQGLSKEEVEGHSNREETPKPVCLEQELRRPQDKLPEWARHKIVLQDKARPSAYNPHEERDPEFAPPNFYYNDGSAKLTRTASWRDKPGNCEADESRHTVTHQPAVPGENKSWLRQEQERGCQDNQPQQQHYQHQRPLSDDDYPCFPPPPQEFTHLQRYTPYTWQPREAPWQRVTSEFTRPSQGLPSATANNPGPQPSFSSHHSTHCGPQESSSYSRYQSPSVGPSSSVGGSCASIEDLPSSWTANSSSRDTRFEGSQTTDLTNYHPAFSTTDHTAVTPSNEALADFLSYYRHASR